MSTILGVSAFYHDSAAALIKDGDILFAAQEERYTRKKHDSEFPKLAIRAALKHTNIEVAQLDAVVFYDKPLLKFERLLETYLANVPIGFLSFARSMPIWLKQKLYLKSLIRQELRALIAEYLRSTEDLSLDEAKKKAKKTKLPQLLFTEHHQSHAAAAFYPSPFKEAAVICLDGVGEWTTSSMWLGKDNSLRELGNMAFPHSLGLLYSAFTYYCGFRVNSGEYKLMGLAPYGQPKYVDVIEQHLVSVRDDGSFALNMDYFDFATGNRMINKKFEALFDGPALPFDSEVTQKQMDLASSIQVVTENIILKIAKHVKTLTGCENVCLAGGVALNCVANGKLLSSKLFKHIWIQPAAGDAGSALGAALEANYGYFENTRGVSSNQQSILDSKQEAILDNRQDNLQDSMQGAYLGDEFSDDEIIATCQNMQLEYTLHNDNELFDLVSGKLQDEAVVGWFQGRMEFGPRSLGNRSILGDPRSPAMQSKMNIAIKQRESFRPFAPAVLEEDASQWFDLQATSPYMLLVADVLDTHLKAQSKAASGLAQLKQIRSSVPAITHVDNSARVQTVSEANNPKFYTLLKTFKQHTGIGMLINTSFNVRGEPPVCTPNDALRCFLATDMDMLVMGNVVLNKQHMPNSAIEQAKAVTFDKD